MDMVSPILDVVTRLWDCTTNHAVSIRDLQETIDSLRDEMQQLMNRRDDVKRRVEREEEQRHMRRTDEVNGWLHRVPDMEKQVHQILQRGDREIQRKCFGTRSCPRNCRSTYKLRKEASETLAAVTALWSSGHFDVVADSLPQPPADERPMQKTVGLGALYKEVCRCIQDDRVGIIGLYGMGGAGKTTLMTKVNNEFIAAPINNDYYFDIAIWVVVSRPANLGKIQEVIRNKLSIPDHSWRNRSHDEKAVEIFNALKGKRFVLMLDDVWERLDLQKVGVPPPKQYSQNRSKVILTTRKLDVCRHMEAQRSIQVVCLTEKEAIHLFKEKVGETTINSHPQIPKFAEIAAKECKGLPLALVTIGRAMAGKNTPQEWERAIEILKTYPSEFSGMGDYVFPILKFSYDNLPNDTIRNCFLYLAIFPEDYFMSIEKLIILWIGEGFLDGWDSIADAFDHGHDIIEHLKTASLFEYNNTMVKMHDVIRDMALWLAANTGDKNKILGEEVESRVEVVRQSSKWKDAQRMHLWITASIEQVTRPFSFPNLLTLIVRTGGLQGTIFPSGFFRFMPIIKVLDLEGTGITQLPVEIGKLVTLEHLNLSRTGIRELPWELSTLKVLRCLLLGNMNLEVISKGVISNLSMMRFFVLNISFETLFLWEDNKEILEELEGLEHINCVNFQVIGTLCFQKLLNSEKLQDVMRELVAENLEDMTVLQLPKMKHLRYLKIRGGKKLEEIKVDEEEEKELMEGKPGLGAYNYIPTSNFYHLRRVHVEGLPKLLHLGWLIHTPNLEYLYVVGCESIEEVVIINIGDDGAPENNILGVLFSRLEELHLERLPNLWSISRQALTFPSLIKLVVSRCPKLRKLPFDSNTARNTTLKTIKGESGWWEGLQWEDEAVRLTFAPYHTTR